MYELLNSFIDPSVNHVITFEMILVRLGITLLMTFILALVYQRIHSDQEDCHIMMHSMIYIGIIITGTMMVIGTSMVVAFGMLGAVSIIRFRSAMKNPIDMSFIFLSIVTGISSGVGFISLAVIIGLVVGTIMLVLNKTRFGKTPPNHTRCEITVIVKKKKVKPEERDVLQKILGEDVRIQEIRVKEDRVRMQFIKTITDLETIKELYEAIQQHFSDDPSTEVRITRKEP